MNEQLSAFARDTIKRGLQQLPVEQQTMFKRMYAHGQLSKDIDAVVDDMPDDKLDWAMQQVQRSIDKLSTEVRR